jgi:hypothetical protein
MRHLHDCVRAQPNTPRLVAIIVAIALLEACAPAHLVVTGDPKLAGIRTVYVLPFVGGDEGPDAAAAMTYALKEQLKYDGIFQVVEDPKAADAYFKGTVGKWSQGGLDRRGVQSTEISGSLTILDPARQRLWFAAAVQRDPLRLVAHGLFSRHPSALAPYWVKAVLQQLPGYAFRERHDASVGHDSRATRPAS